MGIRVASIRSTGRYVKDHPERVEALESLGFEWRLRAAVGDKAKSSGAPKIGGKTNVAAKATEAQGDSTPQAESATPDIVAVTRGEAPRSSSSSSVAASVSSPPPSMTAPDTTGILPEGDPAAVSFDALVVALREYISVHGDAAVPATFVVPDAAPWPMSCRSMPLGMCLNQVVTRGAYLNKRLIKSQLVNGMLPRAAASPSPPPGKDSELAPSHDAGQARSSIAL